MKAPDPEAEKLKEFMLDHFDFDSLKSAHFWPKGTRRDDYRAQAARVCQFFGFKSVYEYNPPDIIDVPGGAIVDGPGSVNDQGQYEEGVKGWLSTCEGDFECPHCTCTNEYKNNVSLTQTCKGCKRKLGVAMDFTGNIHVWEK